VPGAEGSPPDLRLFAPIIAEAIGSTRVTITRLLGRPPQAGLVQVDRKKITVFDPVAPGETIQLRWPQQRRKPAARYWSPRAEPLFRLAC